MSDNLRDPKAGHRYLFRCGECDGAPDWRIERTGDAAVTWACDAHLADECHRMQRDWEVTELNIWSHPKLAEVAEINARLMEISDE